METLKLRVAQNSSTGFSGSFAAGGSAENVTVKLDAVQNSSTEFSGTSGFLKAAGEENFAGFVGSFGGAAVGELGRKVKHTT